MDKTYLTAGTTPESQIGATLEALAKTIHNRASANEASYTYRLLQGDLDELLKKLVEEAHETTLAAKDYFASESSSDDQDHLRYEAGDLVYHLLVLLERSGISLDEFSAELNTRMTQEELADRSGVVMLHEKYINRGNNH